MNIPFPWILWSYGNTLVMPNTPGMCWMHAAMPLGQVAPLARPVMFVSGSVIDMACVKMRDLQIPLHGFLLVKSKHFEGILLEWFPSV